MHKDSKEGSIWENRLVRRIFFYLILAIVVLLVLRGISAKLHLPHIFENKEGTVTTISKTSLQEMLEESKLSTLEYVYNSIAAVYDEDGEIKYHVAYEGTVTMGIDFSKIDVNSDDGKKEIVITLPEVEIQDVNVQIETMEYIFKKEKYETENVSQEAYKVCTADLKEKAGQTHSLFNVARENTKDAVSALIEPWKKQVDAEYTVEVKWRK